MRSTTRVRQIDLSDQPRPAVTGWYLKVLRFHVAVCVIVAAERWSSAAAGAGVALNSEKPSWPPLSAATICSAPNHCADRDSIQANTGVIG
ncbi:MAG TPA: hypothetical protein VG013_17350 [Gemmataceae bacterium]|jgi:hypothetical protein|nr:hypothetical protein [Gemmataceae bacterium]